MQARRSSINTAKPDSSGNATNPALSGRVEEGEEAAYLALLGDRVREMRARRGMTRKILARDSGVSERYLALLEGGRGNISVLLLRQLARALDTRLEEIVHDGPEPSVDFSHAVEVLRRLREDDLGEARRILADRFGDADLAARRNRIALIGLRGAGKSTLGAMLAGELNVPFIELDKEIEQDSGMPMSAIFDLYGQPGFRRFERRCLDRLIDENFQGVIATGGSLVSEAATFERLLASCFTVWVKAQPVTHMSRVVAQGDMRPMSNSREAMADLQRILRVREALYRRADAQVDTTDRSVEASLAELRQLVAAQA